MLPVAAGRELDRPLGEGEERVVATDADVLAGVELGAALADDDVPRDDPLPAKALHAQPLRVRVATVAGGTGAFLRGKKLQVKAEHSRESIADAPSRGKTSRPA